MSYGAKKVFSTILGLLLFTNILWGQSNEKASLQDESPCAQTKDVRNPLIDEAERNEFNTLRVEISGNTYTRGREFWKRMSAGLNEGDIFTRRALEETVRRISKMKSIYPISMENVLVRLNRTTEQIDILFCVIQKPRN